MLGRPLGMCDLQLSPHHTNLLQATKDFLGHPFREVHEAVVLANVDLADMAAFEARLVRYGADDVSRLHAVDVADFDAEGFVRDVAGTALALTRLGPAYRRANG